MDFKKIIPIAIIAIAILSLVAYYALKPAEQVTPIISSQPPTAAVPNQTDPSVSSTPSPNTPAAPVTPPANVQPVSSQDPATDVPDGTDLKQYCDTYYKAWLKKDWQACFKMQPLSKQEGTDAASFGSSRESYGLVAYELAEPTIVGNAATLVASLDLGQNGGMDTIWTFVKNDKGQWVVQDSKTAIGQ